MTDGLAEMVRGAVHDFLHAHGDSASGAALADFGLPEFLDEDDRTAISVFFDEAGRSAAATAGLDVLAGWLLKEVAADSEAVALVIQPRGAADGTVSGLLLGPDTSRARILVADAGECRAHLYPAANLETKAIAGIDPSSHARIVTLTLSQAEATELPADIPVRLISGLRRAVAYELVGLSARMLEVSCAHVSARVQFGRPIGANQSVQHRLADVYTAIQAARAVLDATWAGADEWLTCAVAYVLASEATDTAIRHSLQVCGGMAFTEEFALAPLVRRALLLCGVFEAPDEVASEIAKLLAEEGAVPRLGGFTKEDIHD